MNKKRLSALALAAMLALAVAAPAQAATRAEIEAQIAMLKAQLAALVGGTTMNFMSNLTVGSAGPEVTRLQSFLIEKGYAIPAGATGYFGEQTRSALAKFQAASGIAPAAGYFGTLTRTKVNAMLVVVAPPAPPQQQQSNQDAEDAEDAIDDLDAAIESAQDDIDDAEDDGEDVDDANDILDDARAKLDDAEEAFDDEDYDEAMDLADEGMDLVDDALDEVDTGSDTNGDAETNETSAVTTNVSGADNDYATFTLKLTLSAIGGDMFIPRAGDDAFTYRIENASSGSTVSSGTRTGTLSSSADTEGDYFVIREDEEEDFTIRVTFDPQSSDEGGTFRMQLLTIEYANEEEPPTDSWSTHEDNEFETEATYIAD